MNLCSEKLVVYYVDKDLNSPGMSHPIAFSLLKLLLSNIALVDVY